MKEELREASSVTRLKTLGTDPSLVQLECILDVMDTQLRSTKELLQRSVLHTS